MSEPITVSAGQTAVTGARNEVRNARASGDIRFIEAPGERLTLGQDEVTLAIERFHDQGLTIIGSIKALRSRFGLTLGEAKRSVSSHPVWARAVRDAQSLHDEAERALLANDPE